ncbi:hypothetical protein [Frankia sp. Cj5]|uniref:hypothetical protein n=1 Tax=Frankia sp. Cj5 TaxID=2880978 RepID=UPI001EF64F66|nr:hypothetical protein [Frankia sp. Cj5]
MNCAFSLCWHDSTTPAEPPTPSPPDDNPQPVRSGTPLSWPVSLRQVRACLTPLHLLLRIWQAWTTTPIPHPLRELIDMLAAGHRLCLYLPP